MFGRSAAQKLARKRASPPDCKSVHTGSIPVLASTIFQILRPIPAPHKKGLPHALPHILVSFLFCPIVCGSRFHDSVSRAVLSLESRNEGDCLRDAARLLANGYNCPPVRSDRDQKAKQPLVSAASSVGQKTCGEAAPKKAPKGGSEPHCRPGTSRAQFFDQQHRNDCFF